MKKGDKVIVTTWKDEYLKPVRIIRKLKLTVADRKVIVVTSRFGPLPVFADECMPVK